MIWFDLVTPKSVLFFKPVIEAIRERGQEVLITTRQGEGYTEIVELLKLFEMDFVDRGVFGGGKLEDKLIASIDRQKALMEYISLFNVKKLVSLCSVDANRVAFGLGIPVVNFYDIPLSDHKMNFKKALPQARLTLPLSNRVIKPFVVPDDIFMRFSLDDEQIYEYNFIDPLIWLEKIQPDCGYVKMIFDKYGLDFREPYIIIREEEYKASYVMKKYPFLYDSVAEIKELTCANVVFIPRYESSYLKSQFPDCTVIEEKIVIQHLLAYSSLFIGGGGTLNTEACYFGTPTISTRSFVSHYDKYQIDSGLMEWVTNKEELLETTKKHFGNRKDDLAKEVFGGMVVDVDGIVDNILGELHVRDDGFTMFSKVDD